MKICILCDSEFKTEKDTVEYFVCSDCEKAIAYEEYLEQQYEQCNEEYLKEY